MLSSCLISVPFNLQCLCISSMTPFLILLGTYTDITPGCPPGFPKSQNFNIRFQGANVWNDISDDLKLLSLKPFKKKLTKSQILLINIHCRFINTIFFSGFPLFETAYLAFFSSLSWVEKYSYYCWSQ